MQTAGHIASLFGSNEITINYRASDVLLSPKYAKNPAENLEYIKCNLNFKEIERTKKSKGEYFPEGVYFREPWPPADYKKEIFENFPESGQQGHLRGLSLIEMVNQRIREESDDGKKSICYLIISHKSFVD